MSAGQWWLALARKCAAAFATGVGLGYVAIWWLG